MRLVILTHPPRKIFSAELKKDTSTKTADVVQLPLPQKWPSRSLAPPPSPNRNHLGTPRPSLCFHTHSPNTQRLRPPVHACARAPSPQTAILRPPQPSRRQDFPITICGFASRAGKGNVAEEEFSACLGPWRGSYSTPFPLAARGPALPANNAWGADPVAEKRAGEARMGLRIVPNKILK